MTSVREYILLTLLVEEELPSKTIIEIVKRMGEDVGRDIGVAQIYARLWELEKDGLIERDSTVWRLTKKGKEVAETIAERICEEEG